MGPTQVYLPPRVFPIHNLVGKCALPPWVSASRRNPVPGQRLERVQKSQPARSTCAGPMVPRTYGQTAATDQFAKSIWPLAKQVLVQHTHVQQRPHNHETFHRGLELYENIHGRPHSPAIFTR